MEFAKVVNLKPIDPEKIKIEMVPGSENNYIVWLELDSEPDSIWTSFFYDEVAKNSQISQANFCSPSSFIRRRFAHLADVNQSLTVCLTTQRFLADLSLLQ